MCADVIYKEDGWRAGAAVATDLSSNPAIDVGSVVGWKAHSREAEARDESMSNENGSAIYFSGRDLY
jgi:hypothetical protein